MQWREIDQSKRTKGATLDRADREGLFKEVTFDQKPKKGFKHHHASISFIHPNPLKCCRSRYLQEQGYQEMGLSKAIFPWVTSTEKDGELLSHVGDLALSYPSTSFRIRDVTSDLCSTCLGMSPTPLSLSFLKCTMREILSSSQWCSENQTVKTYEVLKQCPTLGAQYVIANGIYFLCALGTLQRVGQMAAWVEGECMTVTQGMGGPSALDNHDTRQGTRDQLPNCQRNLGICIFSLQKLEIVTPLECAFS